MSNPHLRRICLEVERKFTGLTIYPLTQQGGTPPFDSLEHGGHRTFRDIYYDTRHGQLAAAGTWVRRRDGEWQSKIRQAGDFRNSGFRETQDVREIREQVRSIVAGGDQGGLRRPADTRGEAAFGLAAFADITTHRETWQADGRFTVALDRTDFGHVVGEVELEDHVEVRSEEETARISSRMDRDIVAFMRRYEWAFDLGVPVGKLTAYQRLRGTGGSRP